MNVRNVHYRDLDQLRTFFTDVLHDTFLHEGLEHLVEMRDNEIEEKLDFARAALDGEGILLLAVEDNQIVGTIGFGPANDMITELSGGSLREYGEIGTVYVHPHWQRQGIGKRLLVEMMDRLGSKGIKCFVLDSGYKRAQTYWTQRLGEPTIVAKDYWEKGNHHLIWFVQIESKD